MYNDIYVPDKWMKYDDEAEEYYKAKSDAKKKWQSRAITIGKHSTYGKVN